MKIRTITTGISLNSIREKSKIEEAAEFNKIAKKVFEQEGYNVQTTRIATNSWEDYTSDLSKSQIIDSVKDMEGICNQKDVSFFNIGHATKPTSIELIPDIIQSSSLISASAEIGNKEQGIMSDNIESSAHVIKKIAETTDRGYGNFRFCAWSNCPSGIPFFPAAYHKGKEASFAIGLENGDLAGEAFSRASNIEEAQIHFKNIFEDKLKLIYEIGERLSDEQDIKFRGIDSSLAPGLSDEGSIAYAYEQLLPEKFGYQGTLAVSSMITDVLKNLSVKTCGYSGLMLPVCEDIGLAERANEKTYNLTNLLLYSTVCGCGLDTVPVPGDISEKQLQNILLDTAALAIKLDKPLSVRLFPVPGKIAGQITDFQSPYLIDCEILEVK